MRKIYLKWANYISVSRCFFTIIFVLLFILDTIITRLCLFPILLIIIVSDLIDGFVARHTDSKTSDKTGVALDIACDEFFFITAFVCLAFKGIIPVWLALLIFWTRAFMGYIRLLTAMRGESYPGPRLSTKIKGLSYWISLIYFGGIYSISILYNIYYQPIITQIFVNTMFTLTVLGILDWIIFYRRILFVLFIDKRNI